MEYVYQVIHCGINYVNYESVEIAQKPKRVQLNKLGHVCSMECHSAFIEFLLCVRCCSIMVAEDIMMDKNQNSLPPGA